MAESCEIARLPEDILSAAIALTSPPDACRAAAVSRAFRAAADSDAVWARFLPRDLPQLAAGELIPGPAPPSNKCRFFRLAHRPVLLAGGRMSMWLDRDTGGKCYMLSAASLRIAWRDAPQYWRWISHPRSRFGEVAELQYVCWLEISGEMDSKMLSQGAAYAAYLVFETTDRSFGLDCPPQEAAITVAGSTSTRQVCLQRFDSEEEERAHAAPWWHIGRTCANRRSQRHRECSRDSVLPRSRADGWMELELGEFCSGGDGADDGGDVCIGLTETRVLTPKAGLVVEGIEIRPKKASSS